MEGATVLDESTPAPNTLDLEMDLPDEEEARSCLEVKVWDDYDDEWTLRTAEMITLRTENSNRIHSHCWEIWRYEFFGCTDDKSDAIQLTLYNEKGDILSSVTELGREALMVYKSKESQTVFISIQVEIENPEVKQVGTSLGILVPVISTTAISNHS